MNLPPSRHMRRIEKQLEPSAWLPPEQPSSSAPNQIMGDDGINDIGIKI